MKRILFVFAGLAFMVSGCSNDEGSGEDYPHFKFTNEDKTKLIKPEMLGSTIQYKNQSGEIIQFTVTQCYITTESYGFASFWGSSSSVDYAYDTQRTYVSGSGSGGSINWNVSFAKTPSQRSASYPYKYSNPVFGGRIEFSAFNYNSSDPYSVDCGVISATSGFSFTQSMDIEGKHYDNVKVYYSGVNTAVNSPYEEIHDRTVNKFYYNDDYGIIGYDEIDGTAWRRVN